jgi:hypothetical protein
LSRKEGIGALGACIETNVADERLSDTAHEALVGDQSGLTEEYKACARRAWDELVNLGNLETFEKVYAPTSSGTNPKQTSAAPRKPSGSSPCSVWLSLICG